MRSKMFLHRHVYNEWATSFHLYAKRDSLVTFTDEVISGH